jgi:hypothetical protein
MTYLARITECEHGYTDPHAIDGNEWKNCPGGTTTRIKPDYEAAVSVAYELGAAPASANVDRYLSPYSQGEERKRQLEALRRADEEAHQENLEIVQSIVDAALGDTE